MNTITYKGYIGSVAYSEKDDIFFGKIAQKNLKLEAEKNLISNLWHLNNK